MQGVMLAMMLVVAAPTVAQGPALRDDAPSEYELDASLAWARRALARDSLDVVANWRGALAIIELGKLIPDSVPNRAREEAYREALDWARRAVRLAPDDADARFALANAIGSYALTQGKKERVKLAVEIREEALRAIALDSTHDGAYHVLGRWNAEMMRVSGTARFFAKAFLGAKVFDLASWDEAVRLLERATALDPQRIFHRLDLARVYLDRKRPEDARAQLQQMALLPARNELDERYQAEGRALLLRLEGQARR